MQGEEPLDNIRHDGTSSSVRRYPLAAAVEDVLADLQDGAPAAADEDVLADLL